MAGNIKYGALNIPESLVEELKVWKMAFSMSYGRTVSYAEMIRSMLDSIPQSDPEVSEALEKILEMNPELRVKVNGNSKV
jgi:2-hydroxy-3-keto-5-methylthiopentenyl-1-phosphate phosphatase